MCKNCRAEFTKANRSEIFDNNDVLIPIRDSTARTPGIDRRVSEQRKVNAFPESFVDAVRAGEFLSLRPRRVLELAREGSIPAYPIGTGQRKVWRFKLSDLAQAITSFSYNGRQSSAKRQETD